MCLRRISSSLAPTLAGGMLVAAATTTVACGSASFEIGFSSGGDSGRDSGGGGGGGDTGPADSGAPDTPPDPCAPSASEARFCVIVDVDKDHPGYDGAVAKDLGLDGKGLVHVAFYKDDPVVRIKGELPKPLRTITFPNDSFTDKLDVASSFPTTLSAKGEPGSYFVIVSFQDNKTAPRTSFEGALLPGDFVHEPTVRDDKAVYASVTLATGKTARLEVLLKPLRLMRWTLSNGPKVMVAARTHAINGDGPLYFALYDGDLSSKDTKATFLTVGYAPCVDLKSWTAPPAFPPTPVMSFLTSAPAGKHSAFAALYDYELPTVAIPSPRGTLVTDVGVLAPSSGISQSSWVATASVPLARVYEPYDPGEKIDPLHCPGP